MSVLSAEEMVAITGDVRQIIEACGETARILRPEKSGTDSFFGPHESGEAIIASNVPCELQHLSPEAVIQKGHDAVLHVLPDAGVIENDFVEVAGVRYRVTDIVPHNCYGVITHFELRLEKEYRGGE
jgi:hypothetical protein